MKAASRFPRHSVVLFLALIGLMTGFIVPGKCEDRPLFAHGTKALPTVATWKYTASLNTPRYDHTATLLPNGNVLVVGGVDNTGHTVDTAELYDITTGTWSVTGFPIVSRGGHTATLMQNGKVLVVGGVSYPIFHLDVFLSPSSELYDPTTGTWSITGSPAAPHVRHTATLLPNGKVLIVGGVRRTDDFGPTDDFGMPQRAELYDPAAGTWGPAESPISHHSDHTATLLKNGKVLIVGGRVDDQRESWNPVPSRMELYDPGSGSWREVGQSIIVSYHTATLLPNGNVLMAGGWVVPCPTLSCAELYDPAAETLVYTDNLTIRRGGHTATLLPNGKVLVAAGNGLDLAELYDPDAAIWTSTNLLNVGRAGHTATLLSNGNVLVAGGVLNDALKSAELYGDVALPATVPLIEYFYPGFGHYFITSNPEEITKLDGGAGGPPPEWRRTGLRLNAYAAPNENSAPVCRFFSTAFAPKSSHFYTPFPMECDTVQVNPGWLLESAAAFYIVVPAGDGSCAAGFTPVYRLYNNGQGAAPNHRYTTDLTVRAQMVAQGWVPEGLGRDAVEMCSPP